MPFGPWPPGGGSSFPGFGPAPPDVAGSGSAGTAPTASRSDHTHGSLATNAPPNTNPANASPASVVGTSAKLAREDHTHGGPLAQSWTNTVVLGPATDIVLTTPTVTSVRSGLFHVVCVASADASAISTQVITGGHDSTTDATSKAGTGGAGPFNGACTWVVQLTAGSSHTFFVKAHVNSGGGTNTAQAGWFQISIIEF
jgi:hypothetical protein